VLEELKEFEKAQVQQENKGTKCPGSCKNKKDPEPIKMKNRKSRSRAQITQITAGMKEAQGAARIK
jgi:hypothetical protein